MSWILSSRKEDFEKLCHQVGWLGALPSFAHEKSTMTQGLSAARWKDLFDFLLALTHAKKKKELQWLLKKFLVICELFAGVSSAFP